MQKHYNKYICKDYTYNKTARTGSINEVLKILIKQLY